MTQNTINLSELEEFRGYSIDDILAIIMGKRIMDGKVIVDIMYRQDRYVGVNVSHTGAILFHGSHFPAGSAEELFAGLDMKIRLYREKHPQWIE